MGPIRAHIGTIFGPIFGPKVVKWINSAEPNRRDTATGLTASGLGPKVVNSGEIPGYGDFPLNGLKEPKYWAYGHGRGTAGWDTGGVHRFSGTPKSVSPKSGHLWCPKGGRYGHKWPRNGSISGALTGPNGRISRLWREKLGRKRPYF